MRIPAVRNLAVSLLSIASFALTTPTNLALSQDRPRQERAPNDAFAALNRSAESIRRVVGPRVSAVSGCYELMVGSRARSQGSRSRMPEGRLVARFNINGSGEVSSCEVEGDEAFTRDATMPSCVCNVLRSLQFDAVASGHNTTVNYPFRFQADR